MSNQTLDRLSQLDTPSISDAMDKLGVPCGLPGLKPVVRGHHICGTAFTVHYVPCGSVRGSVGDFLDNVAAGQVVAIDNGGRTFCTVWGDIMTFAARSRGLAGTVIDGVCRDIPGIKELNYPVFSRDVYMVTGKDRVMVDDINRPIAISGLQICAGDFLVGDDSGVVVVPVDLAPEVIEIAQNIENTEQSILEDIKNGMTLKQSREIHGYHNLQSKDK